MIFSVILMSKKWDGSWFSTKFRSFLVLRIHLFFLNLRSIDNYQSIYVELKFPLKDIFSNISLLWKKMRWKRINFQFLLHLPGTSQHFLRSNDLLTYLHTCIYVKLRYIAAQEVPFLEFHIPNFRKVLWHL